MISSAVDRAIASYTMMGLRADEQRRQMLRKPLRCTLGVTSRMDRPTLSASRVLGLKHLVSMEKRERLRGRRMGGTAEAFFWR